MRPYHALPLVSALALALPALALTTTATSATGTNGSTATVDTTTAASTGAGRTVGVRVINQDPLGLVSPEGVPATSAPPIAGSEVIAANGERIAVNSIASVQSEPAATTPTPELDAATRAAERKLRAKAARKQQLMHSITPRTNVDRTDQMPDDPIGPALR